MKFINWQETVKNPCWKQWLRNKDQMCGTLRGKKNCVDFTLEFLFVCVILMVSKQYSARGKEPGSYHTALYSVMMPERERGKMTRFLLENAAVKHYREHDCVCVCAIVGLRAHFRRTKKDLHFNQVLLNSAGSVRNEKGFAWHKPSRNETEKIWASKTSRELHRHALRIKPSWVQTSKCFKCCKS